MSRKNGRKSMYVDLSFEQNAQLGVLTVVLPPKPDGTKIHKKDLVATAVGLYLEKLFDLFDGDTDINSMIEKAKETDIRDVQLDVDMSKENSGLKDF